MKKRMIWIAVLMITVLSLSGCMSMEDHITIYEDGRGTVVSRAEFEKDAVDQFAASLQLSAEDLLLEVSFREHPLRSGHRLNRRIREPILQSCLSV